MHEELKYDVAIAGGGLAGLSAAIRLAGHGHSVIIIEKEKYPFHKVCGEYISMESHEYLSSLGLDIHKWKLPVIDQFILTAPNGNSFQTPLPLGGFGISRYKLDDFLYQEATRRGVKILQGTKVEQIEFDKGFRIQTGGMPGQIIYSRACIGSFGKRSNLDVKWKRSFLENRDRRIDNFIGVKYHVRTDWKPNVIGLHNFQNGYCGISRIEDEKYTLCYMTRAANLKSSSNNIGEMEKKILYKNPHLKRIFTGSEILEGFPITISQISFSSKTKVEEHVLLAGDAGGMITPLCGNGMSIALHSGKIAADLSHQFLEGEMSRQMMEEKYKQAWQENFGKRLRNGRVLQRLFGEPALSNGTVFFFRTFPFLAKPVIRQTHGRSF